MLSYSIKGLRKLQENFTCFGDKLADDDVYGMFCQIISKSKTFAKPEMKVYIHTILIRDVSKINCFISCKLLPEKKLRTYKCSLLLFLYNNCIKISYNAIISKSFYLSYLEVENKFL
jgi:hypothetical protein